MGLRIFELCLMCGIIYALAKVLNTIVKGINERKLKQIENDKELNKIILNTLQAKQSRQVRVVLDAYHDKLPSHTKQLLEQKYDDLIILESFKEDEYYNNTRNQ